MRNLQVVPVVIEGIAGFTVQGLWRSCSDSLWEPIAHAAVFRDKHRANRFLDRVSRKPEWEYQWKFWGAPVGHRTSVIDACQQNVAPFSVL